jgi:hypothetical protein
MKFVSIPYNDFIYEIFIYEMLCEIFVRVCTQQGQNTAVRVIYEPHQRAATHTMHANHERIPASHYKNHF